jgi:transposase
MLPIEKIRNIIRTKFISICASARTIAKLCECSHQSVIRVLKKAAKCDLTHPVSLQCTDREITQLLYPSLHEKVGSKRDPNYEVELKESLKKKGKSRTVQYLEYRAIDKETAYSKTQYFYLVRKYLKKRHLTMRQQHRAGEVVYVDYAGTRVCYEKDGKKVWLKVFVGCLGASKKLFAYATVGERTVDWINGMERMFEYFGGVTEVISIDNAKALVTKPGLIAVLVKNLALFGEHFKSIIDACRVGMPQDKSLVELGVKFITQHAIIPMNNDMTFHSADEINAYLAIAVESLNNGKFQKLNTSRNELFDQIEKAELRPLPKTKFEVISDFKINKVPATYHIFHGQHEYSVPYRLAHEHVEIIVNQTHLKVIYQHQLVVVHKLSDEIGGCTTLIDHMPPQHQAEANKTKDEYLKWAQRIGRNVEAYIEVQYQRTTNSKSIAIGKQCQALMNLCANKGTDAVNKACNYALINDMPPSEMGLVFSALDDLDVPQVKTTHLIHQNIRGKDSFGGHHDH